MVSNISHKYSSEKMIDQNENFFSASWDKGIWILNLFILSLVAGLTIALLVASFYAISESVACGIIVLISSIIPPTIIAIAAIFAPRKYCVTTQNVIVKRFARNVTLPLSEIVSIEPVTYISVFKGSTRTMASGGGFGIYGDFYSPKLSNFRAYMTRRNKLVLIRTFNKPFVLTPDDPEGFIATVQKMKNHHKD